MSETTQHEAPAPTEAAELLILLLPGTIEHPMEGRKVRRGIFIRLNRKQRKPVPYADEHEHS